MSEALWIVVIVNLLGFLGLMTKAYFDYKGKKEIAKKAIVTQKVKVANNPHPCGNHNDRLIKIEAGLKSLEKEMGIRFTDVKDDVARLFRKYNGIRK